MSISTDSFDTRVRRRLFAASAVSMFVFGMLIALLGTLFGLPAMRERLGIDLARQGDVFSVMFLGLFVATAVAGPAIDRFGSKLVLVSASAVVTVALAGLALARGFGAAAAFALLLGAGGGWLNTAANALVSDVFPEDRGRMLNLLGTFFGFGALFVPLVVSVGLDVLSIGGTMALCAGVSGAGAVAAMVLPFPAAHEASSFSLASVAGVAKDRGVLLLALLLLFEGGNEAALSGWTSTYVGSSGWSPRAATLILLGYWVMAIGGRALSARAQEWVGKERLVVVGGALATVGCFVLLAAAGSLPGLAAGAWLAALGFSAIFPTVLAVAGDRYRRYAGTVFGFLFTVGNVGNITFPWALGHVSQAFGVRFGMVVPLAGTVAVAVCAGLLSQGSESASRRHGAQC